MHSGCQIAIRTWTWLDNSLLASQPPLTGEVLARPRIVSNNKFHSVLLGFAYRTMRLGFGSRGERRLFLLHDGAIMRIYCVSLSLSFGTILRTTIDPIAILPPMFVWVIGIKVIVSAGGVSEESDRDEREGLDWERARAEHGQSLWSG